MRLSRSVVRVTRRAAVAAGLPLVALAGSLAVAGAPAVADGEEGSSRPDPIGGLVRSHPAEDLDVRRGLVPPSPAQLARVRALDATARWTRFGTPAALTRDGRPLAAGLRGDPAAVARRFVHDNRVLFRMSASRVRDLDVLRDSALANLAAVRPGERAPRARVVVFRERFGGLPAGAGGLVTVGVVGDAVAYVSSSAYGDASAPPDAALTPVDAWLRAAAATGQSVSPSAVGPVERAADPRLWTTFTVAGRAQVQHARLVAVGLPGSGVRSAYEVNVLDVQDGSTVASTSFVDARSGRILVRHNRVDHLFGRPLPLRSPGSAAAYVRGPGCGPGCGILLRAGDSGPVWRALSSPAPFPFGPGGSAPGSVDAVLSFSGASADPADNNNAVTTPAWSAPRPAGGVSAVGTAAAAATGGWSDAWRRSRCDVSTVEAGGNDVGTAVAGVFGLHNRLHDWTYQLGFTEENANLQQDNAGVGGVDRDREVGYVQTGALTGGYPTYLGRNDANQVTLQDGLPAISSLYLFQPVAARWYGPCVDGALDPTVVAHEYAHAVTSRMVGGPDGGLTSPHGREVGEAWSDLLAAEYLLEYGGTGPDGSRPTAIGAYVAGDRTRGVRAYPLGVSPLNLTNALDEDPLGVAGEIWSAVNWDIRAALTEKYDAEFPSTDAVLQRTCADGVRSPSACPGNRRWVQLVLDSLLLQQGDLSMLDARDALLAADLMRFGGADVDDLWRSFALRGLGPDAVLTGDHKRPVADFTVPDSVSGVRSGRLVLDALERPLGGPASVTVFVGDYGAGAAVPVADSDPGTALPGEVEVAPGEYPLTWSAPGFGMGHTTATVRPGRTRYLELYLDRNLASARSGARVETMPSGTGAGVLVDDREDTAWSVDGQVPDARGTAVAIDLAGTRPRRVGSVRVSALTADGFAALRSFAVEACTRAPARTCAVDRPGDWRRLYVSPAAAFPAARPYPKAPDLAFRDFDVPDVRATHLRLVVLQTQCTGNPAYHGEQESDPLSTSDCLASAKAGTAALAEVMVYGADPAARPPTRYASWD